MTNASADRTLKVFRIYIKADAKAIWQAIVDPAWNARYGYLAVSEYDLEPGGAYRALASPDMLAMGASEVMVDGQHDRVGPAPQAGHRLPHAVQPRPRGRGFHHPDLGDRARGRRDLPGHRHPRRDRRAHPRGDRSQRHALLEGGGGWAWILSDLKSLLESGNTMFT